MKWLIKTIKAWVWFFTHAHDLLPPMTRGAMGRFYVFRDSPDYVVKIFADFDLDKSTDSMAKLIMQAREELTLRDRRAAA